VARIRGGEVRRDSDVTESLDHLIEKTSAEDPEFAQALAEENDAEGQRRGWFRAFALLRRRSGVSQSEMARLMGTTQSAISDMERGAVEPRISTLQKYGKLLGYRLRLELVRESLTYTDMSMHYSSRPPLPKASVRQKKRTRKTQIPQSNTIVTLDNVHYVDFQRRNDSRLGGSIAERLVITGRA